MKTLRGFIWGLLLCISALAVGFTAWKIWCAEKFKNQEKPRYGRFSSYGSK